MGVLCLAGVALGTDRLLLQRSAAAPAEPARATAAVADEAQTAAPARARPSTGAILAAYLPPQEVVEEWATPDVFRLPESWEIAQAARARTQEKVEAPPPVFRLSSVSFGERPLARINGDVFARGDEVVEGWTLTVIERRRVVLQSENRQVEALLDPRAGEGN